MAARWPGLCYEGTGCLKSLGEAQAEDEARAGGSSGAEGAGCRAVDPHNAVLADALKDKRLNGRVRVAVCAPGVGALFARRPAAAADGLGAPRHDVAPRGPRERAHRVSDDADWILSRVPVALARRRLVLVQRPAVQHVGENVECFGLVGREVRGLVDRARELGGALADSALLCRHG